ncbi:Zorya protein ZorC EH domain-containing protein [uncultured Gammaproteobacteria bacterium]
MGLREFVSRLPSDWKPKQAVFPSGCRMAEAWRVVETKSEIRLALLPTIDLVGLKQRLVACYKAGDWSGLSPREWRYANECLSIGVPKLIDDPAFVEIYLGALDSRQASASAISQLVRWYLRNFDPEHDGVRRIGAFLTGKLARMRPNWVALHDTYALFEPGEAAHRIAVAVLSSGKSLLEFMIDIRCPITVLSSRLFGYAFIDACRTIAKGPPPGLASLIKLKDWSVHEGRFQYNGIPDAQSRLAEAMLLPWGGQFPDEALREFVVSSLLNLMNDPRTNPTAWTEVSESARNVMLSWMIKDALEQFLQVVDETVQTYQSRIWAERRQFWLSYYESKLIRECWVVFGRRGAALARHLATEKSNPALANFGGLTRDVGGDPSQAVLLLRIGDLLVADWSHNARCYIWRPENKSAPKLYQGEYLREELLSGADFETPHHKQWQDNARDYISSQIGLAMHLLNDSKKTR